MNLKLYSVLMAKGMTTDVYPPLQPPHLHASRTTILKTNSTFNNNSTLDPMRAAGQRGREEPPAHAVGGSENGEQRRGNHPADFVVALALFVPFNF